MEALGKCHSLNCIACSFKVEGAGMSENEPGKPQKGWGWLQWGVAVG
jgi:hypothetical protein